MLRHDTRLIQYDQTPKEERPALLATLFDEPELCRTFRHVAEDRVTRAIMEFQNLDVVPYEDYQLLLKRGYLECWNFFRTYVPAARGLEFPEVRMTRKGHTFKIKGINNNFTEKLFHDLILAYRVRNTGQGVVAGRETLEEWLEDGDETYLDALVDPDTGAKLEAFRDISVYWELCNPSYRDELIRKRAGNKVADPITDSKFCLDLNSPQKLVDTRE